MNVKFPCKILINEHDFLNMSLAQINLSEIMISEYNSSLIERVFTYSII